MLGFSIFHVWGLIDAIAAPPEHNRRLSELQNRLGLPAPMYTRLYLAPTDRGGGTVGLSLPF